MTQHIALYGKEGVGKTTLATNISAALMETGFTVVLVGCDRSGDSCSLLLDGVPEPELLDRITGSAAISRAIALHSGFRGVGCVELGGLGRPESGTAYDVSASLEELKRLRLIERANPDYVLYDISGDDPDTVLRAVIRQVEICRLFVVTSSDFKALQSANHAFGFLGLYNGESAVPLPMGGLILNSIANSFEEAFVNDFAYRTNARIIGKVPRSLVVRQCELSGRTVIESSPQSNQSYYYRRLANRIVDATGALYTGNLPQPMSAEGLRNWSLEWAERIHVLENGLVSEGAAI